MTLSNGHTDSSISSAACRYDEAFPFAAANVTSPNVSIVVLCHYLMIQSSWCHEANGNWRLFHKNPSSWKGSTKPLGKGIFSFYGTAEYSSPQRFLRILLPRRDAETCPFGERGFSENIPSPKGFWESPFPQRFSWPLPGSGIFMKQPPDHYGIMDKLADR